MSTTPFASQSIQLPQGELTYFVAGSGRPLVHLHGAGGVRPNRGLELLAESLTVYLPVLPGFDGTPEFAGISSMQHLARVMADFLDAAIGETADILGLSFGGWLAAWLAVLYSGQVGQLCLENPAGFLPADAAPPSHDPEVRQRAMYAYPERRPPETKSGVSKSTMELSPVFGFRFSSFPVIQSLQAPPDGPPAGTWLSLPGYLRGHSFLCESLIY